MKPTRTAVLAVLAASLVLAPSSARADDDAEALIRQGVQLRREHRNVEALDLFARALALSPTPRARAQVALAEQALGRWLEAERDLDAALASDQDAWIAKNHSVLEQARGTIAQQLAWLTVLVDAPSAEAELDGRQVPCGVETRALARSSVLKVRAPGYAPEERPVTLGPAQHVQQKVVLTPVAPVAPVAPDAPAPVPAAPSPVDVSPAPAERPRPPELGMQPSREPAARFPAPVGPLSLGVAGVVGLGVGAYFGLRAADFKRSEEASCAGGRCSPAAAVDWKDAESSATAATIGIGAGIALVAAGGVWWLLWNRDLRKSTHAIRVTPMVGGVTGIAVASDL
jgi:serine/threonine-protein kinase